MGFKSFMKKLDNLTNKVNRVSSSVSRFNRAVDNLASKTKSKNTIKLPAPRGKDKAAPQSTGPDKSPR